MSDLDIDTLLTEEYTEILTKLAMLLEVKGSGTTGVLLVNSQESTSLVLASNNITAPIKERQEQVLASIKKATLDDADREAVCVLCYNYVKANVKKFASKVLCRLISKDLTKLAKSNTKELNAKAFYTWVGRFIKMSTTFIEKYFKGNIMAKLEPQNLTLILNSTQQLILSFMTIRYFYHLPETDEGNNKCKMICSIIRKIDSIKLVRDYDQNQRHAEVILIGYIMKYELYKSNKLVIHP